MTKKTNYYIKRTVPILYDLKTGNAKLTAEQIKHIQTQTRTKVQVTVIRGK